VELARLCLQTARRINKVMPMTPDEVVAHTNELCGELLKYTIDQDRARAPRDQIHLVLFKVVESILRELAREAEGKKSAPVGGMYKAFQELCSCYGVVCKSPKETFSRARSPKRKRKAKK
jgi:hypothetical protein